MQTDKKLKGKPKETRNNTRLHPKQYLEETGGHLHTMHPPQCWKLWRVQSRCNPRFQCETKKAAFEVFIRSYRNAVVSCCITLHVCSRRQKTANLHNVKVFCW